MRPLVFYFVVCGVFMSGCFQTVRAKAEMPIKTVVFSNKKKLTVEWASTPEQRHKGLMHRESLPSDRGMFFQFQRERELSFWMKNTYIPLEIGFFDKNMALVNIEFMAPQPRGPVANPNLKSYRSHKPCLFALEVNPGWFKDNGITVGTTFKVLP